jgi:CheY-like chemotaxis protein
MQPRRAARVARRIGGVMSRRILLADDSLTIQKVVELTFADTEYEVVAVSSGDELLRRLPESSADVIICDVIMPGRDGYDICQEIKSNPDFLHLPVILLTGTFEPFDRDRALAAGCSEIVTKPFEAKKLVDAVERLVSASGDKASPADRFADEPFAPGQVTPPQPMIAPEELDEFESFADLDDTAATAPQTPVEPKSAEDEEALDFSTSGFLEMEEVGRERINQSLEAPPDGLEFEPELESPDLSAAPSDPFVDRTSRAAGFGPGAAPGSPTPPVVAAGGGAGEVELDDPFAAPPTAGDDSDEPFPAPLDEAEEQALEAAPDVETSMTTPIDVASVMGADAPSKDAEPPAAAGDEDILGDADTQDLAVKPKAERPPDRAPDAEMQRLSDDDVDRIARRVVELSGQLIEHIAWEVVPDMAEIVVRERVREIEAAAENEQP